MKIGVVTTSFPRYPGDFAGCFVEDAVRELVARGDDVDVLAAASGTAGDREVDQGARLRVFRVPAGPSRASTVGPRAFPLFYGAGAPEALERGGPGAWSAAVGFSLGLVAEIRARGADWSRVEAHWLVPCAVAALLAAPALPLRAHAHSGDIALLERIPGGRTLARLIARHTTDVAFASEDLLRRFARLAGRVVGCVAPVEARSLGPRAPRADVARPHLRQLLGLRERTVLSVGRLVPIKGFDVLLKAVALAGARGTDTAAPLARPEAGTCLHAPEAPVPGLEVVILGDGPERERLEALARRLNVRLRLPGLVLRPEVARWMAAADIYVQPSRRLANGRTEGIPVATREAIAAGLPLVVTTTGGMPELARRHPDVRLVAPDDPRALASCL